VALHRVRRRGTLALRRCAGSAVQCAQAGEDAIAFERARFERAPVVVAVVSRAVPHAKVPEWEQQLSAGAVCQNMLVAATAMGFASQWLTEWYGFDEEVARALGLGVQERVAGFIYLASAREAPGERARPAMEDIVSHWGG
jgi:nitroreductase